MTCCSTGPCQCSPFPWARSLPVRLRPVAPPAAASCRRGTVVRTVYRLGRAVRQCVKLSTSTLGTPGPAAPNAPWKYDPNLLNRRDKLGGDNG